MNATFEVAAWDVVGALEALASSRNRIPREDPDVETSSEDYARRFSGTVGAWFLKIQEQQVLRMLASWKHASILEVGGGHGQLTQALIEAGHHVTVLGSSDQCRARIQPWIDEGHCTFVTGNLLDLPYTDRAFDVVISIRLLPHMRAWKHLIGEMSRVAREGVIVDYPTGRSLNCLTPALFSAKRSLEGNTRPYTLFNHKEIAGEFAAYGYGRKIISPEFFWPMVLHRMLKAPAVSRSLEFLPGATGLTQLFGSPVLALFTRPHA